MGNWDHKTQALHLGKWWSGTTSLKKCEEIANMEESVLGRGPQVAGNMELTGNWAKGSVAGEKEGKLERWQEQIMRD